MPGRRTATRRFSVPSGERLRHRAGGGAAVPPPRDREFAFLVTGYSESIDSFFAFGLFELARQSGFFPAELVETFEPVIQEECRHILFFANWLAWHRANLNWWRRIRFELRVAAAWVYIAGLRVGLARSVGTNRKATQQESNFTVNGAQAVTAVEIGFLDLMQICLQENDRRLAGYDPRLCRPTRVPALARFVLAVGKLWPSKKRLVVAGELRNRRISSYFGRLRGAEGIDNECNLAAGRSDPRHRRIGLSRIGRRARPDRARRARACAGPRHQPARQSRRPRLRGGSRRSHRPRSR